MVRAARERLSGCVEVDETYVGGEEEGTHGRETYTKAIVAVAVEMRDPKGFGRIRVKRVPDVSSASLTPFVCQAVEPGSTVHTDGWKGYNDLGKRGYHRKVTVLSASGDPAHVVMPGVHRIASLLKRWLLGTHQGAVSNRHLDYYLDEYTFRFNRRASASRGPALLPTDAASGVDAHDFVPRSHRRSGRGHPERVGPHHNLLMSLARSGYPPSINQSDAIGPSTAEAISIMARRNEYA